MSWSDAGQNAIIALYVSRVHSLRIDFDGHPHDMLCTDNDPREPNPCTGGRGPHHPPRVGRHRRARAARLVTLASYLSRRGSECLMDLDFALLPKSPGSNRGLTEDEVRSMDALYAHHIVVFRLGVLSQRAGLPLTVQAYGAEDPFGEQWVDFTTWVAGWIAALNASRAGRSQSVSFSEATIRHVRHMLINADRAEAEFSWRVHEASVFRVRKLHPLWRFAALRELVGAV